MNCNMSQSSIDSSQYSENDPMMQTKISWKCEDVNDTQTATSKDRRFMPKRKPGIQL